MLVQGMHIHPWGHLILQKNKMEHSDPDLGDKQQERRNVFLNLHSIPKKTNNFAPDITCRKEFMEYFVSPERSVPWKNEHA